MRVRSCSVHRTRSEEAMARFPHAFMALVLASGILSTILIAPPAALAQQPAPGQKPAAAQKQPATKAAKSPQSAPKAQAKTHTAPAVSYTHLCGSIRSLSIFSSFLLRRLATFRRWTRDSSGSRRDWMASKREWPVLRATCEDLSCVWTGLRIASGLDLRA